MLDASASPKALLRRIKRLENALADALDYIYECNFRDETPAIGDGYNEAMEILREREK